MSLAKATETYRLDAKQGHTLLTKEEREQLIKVRSLLAFVDLSD